MATVMLKPGVSLGLVGLVSGDPVGLEWGTLVSLLV